MKKESQGYMYNIKTKSITFLNRVQLSISYMKVKYIVHVCSCQGRSVVTIGLKTTSSCYNSHMCRTMKQSLK